jgi:DNA-binding protein YbaB
MAFVGLWLSVVVVRRGKSSCGKNKCCLHPVIRNGYYPSPRVSKFIMQTQQKSTNDDDWNRALEKAELFSQYNQQLQQQLSQTRVRAQSMDGLVVAQYTGNQVPCSVQVDEKLVEKGNVEMISKAITEAVVGAYEASLALSLKEMASVAKSLGLNNNNTSGTT